IPVILLGSFAVPQIPHICDKIADVNARWRLEYWFDSATAIVDSKGLGIGYGTAYASTTFAKGKQTSEYEQTCETCGNVTGFSQSPFDSNNDYTVEQRPYVVATHNSFVSVALRMGVLGLALFCGLLLTIWRRLTKSKCSDMGAMMFLFCGVLFTISLNVGLESPGYFGVFMVSMCLISSYISQPKVEEKEQ
ncbi:MAG: O-antigen ligase family protein, partial [Oscillospiraceae bacterium]